MTVPRRRKKGRLNRQENSWIRRRPRLRSKSTRLPSRRAKDCRKPAKACRTKQKRHKPKTSRNKSLLLRIRKPKKQPKNPSAASLAKPVLGKPAPCCLAFHNNFPE